MKMTRPNGEIGMYMNAPNQPDMFDLAKAERLKTAGMKTASENRKDELDYAKQVAVRIAQTQGTVTADDVQRVLLDEGIQLGNAAGSLFRGNQWLFTGEWRKSERTTNHARQNRVWALI